MAIARTTLNKPVLASEGSVSTPAQYDAIIDAAIDRVNAISTETTTKGDILAANASAEIARLGVGTDGYVLTASAAASLGVAWAALDTAHTIPVVNVKDPTYGATGDGVTDEAAAFTAAFAAGNAIHVPAGNYKMGSTITATGKYVFGPGRLFSDVAGLTVIEAGAGTVLEGLTIDQTDTSVGNRAVSVIGSGVRISRCSFPGASTTQGIAIASAVAGVLIESCSFDGGSYGVLVGNGNTTITNVRVIGCTFANLYGDAVEFNSPGTVDLGISDCLVQGCYITATNGTSASAGFGVGIAGGNRITIDGNVFGHCRYQAVHIEDESQDIVVSNNIIRGPITGSTEPDSANSGIYAQDVDGLVVSGNLVTDAEDDGIHCDYSAGIQATRVSITGNVVRSCGGNGISIDGASTEQTTVAISGNTSSDNTLAGIEIGGGAFGGSVTGNICTGNTTYGISLGTSQHQALAFTGNVLIGNTSGTYYSGNSYYRPLVDRHDYRASLAVAGVGYTDWVDVLPLGRSCQGILRVAFDRANVDVSYTNYLIKWDGTVLISEELSSGKAGATGYVATQLAGNVVQARIYWSSGANTLIVTASFLGSLTYNAPNTGLGGTSKVDVPIEVTGSKGANAALTSLCTQLATLGFITDSTT